MLDIELLVYLHHQTIRYLMTPQRKPFLSDCQIVRTH